MSTHKIVYVKPKGLIRELAQKLFLEFLLKMFPKQFLSYKNKIRTIMNKGKHYVSFVLLVAYLRFRYPHYINLPPKHIIALHTLIKFLKILKLQRIDFFLIAGSLLGAVRQGSFAGSPSDVDLGIKENQLSKLFDAFPLLKTSGVKAIRRFPENKPIRFQFLYPCTLVDVGIYRKTNIRKKKMWTGENEWKVIFKKKLISKKKAASKAYYLNRKKPITFPLADLEHLRPINVYGKKFLSPANPEIYLEKKYGKNWRIPDKKQFFWNKNYAKRSGAIPK